MKIQIPAFVPMAKCNEHLANGPIDIDLGPDVVQVVRCKDCKHHQIMENKKSFMYWHNCKLWCADISDDDFCSYGEPKDGGGNG